MIPRLDTVSVRIWLPLLQTLSGKIQSSYLAALDETAEDKAENEDELGERDILTDALATKCMDLVLRPHILERHDVLLNRRMVEQQHDALLAGPTISPKSHEAEEEYISTKDYESMDLVEQVDRQVDEETSYLYVIQIWLAALWTAIYADDKLPLHISSSTRRLLRRGLTLSVMGNVLTNEESHVPGR